jgi:hypothetical protein
MPDVESGPSYSEIAGQRERQLKNIIKTIEAWPNVSDAVKTEVAKKSTDFLDSHIERGTFAGGTASFLSWIIKDDDLKLLEQLIPAAMAIVTFLSVPDAPIAVMIAGLAFSTLGIANKFRTKGIIVEPADFHILMVLKQAGPSKASRIAEILSGLHIYGRDVWDEQRAVAVLNKLKLLPQNDGTTVTIVNESSDGRWSTAGI